ncbi:Catechol 2,3-dioxygenase [Sphingomonas laterariae]|uniref:Catechol 2,3-dioxygenase n=1 Tax=Edaphosphingomonas laterariae TaxID=861865 RepID=A0A239H171_9SPHN|nr:VOC family protein [Sphingomonas laterariae]SNS74798.1 Catechol 2,3-dioxygenase [Sphingomonas laterariae]
MESQAAHFGFTKLLVHDLEKIGDFYKQVCGLTELYRVESEIAGRPISEILFNATGVGAATFVLLKFGGAPKPTNDEVILGFITPDVVAFVERAVAAGGKIVQEVREQREHGVKVGFVTDVEGHLIEVVEMLQP